MKTKPNLLRRRVFVQQMLFAGAASSPFFDWIASGATPGADLAMTVLGPIPTAQLGVTLAHEQGVVDFLGAEKSAQLRHDRDEAFKTILPHFKNLAKLGCATLVECTPKYIGRDVILLKRLAEASGLNVITNTGYYGASDNKFLPKHAFTESADQIAARWLAEWRDGIDGSGIRPGFMKLGVGSGRLPEIHIKLVRAAARTHRQCGLPIAIHTGNGEAALDEIRIVEEEGVSPGALIWVHAQNDPGPVQIQAARRGAWVSLDGFGASASTRERYKGFLTALRRERLLDRALISHDHFWSVEGEGPSGTLKLHADSPAPFQSIFTTLLPDLRESGFTDSEIRQLTIANPGKAFAINVRPL